MITSVPRAGIAGLVPFDHHSTEPMTTTDRVAALAQLTEQLAALTTAEERKAFPFMEHLTDLIEELEEE